MNIFFDTEFTGLHKNTTLISIGCISENNKEFYAEFTDYDNSQCNNWIKENVINNLKYNHRDSSYVELIGNYTTDYDISIKGNTEDIKKEFRRWLRQFDSVQFISDVCHYDFVLLIDILGTAFDLPKHVSPVCHDINQDIAVYLDISDKDAFNVNREEFARINNSIEKHNALWDAKVIKKCYDRITYRRIK